MILVSQMMSPNDTFDYDPDLGELTRKKTGRTAGYIHSSGYRVVWFERKKYGAHVLIWKIVTGEWPSQLIDHRDLNRSNNSWDNLRAATRTQNIRNGGVKKNNALGVKGVRRTKSGSYQARIMTDGKVKGRTFKSMAQAKHWLTTVRDTDHGEFARN